MSFKIGSRVVFGVLAISALSSHAFGATSYLADVIVSAQSKKVELSEVVDELSKAKLISIGETHSVGIEREHIRDLYTAMIPRLAQKPECFAESFPVLISPKDIVYPLFMEACKSVTSVLGNGPGKTTFAKPFEKAFDKGLVLTQSGHRHVMPIGQYFPGDYAPANIDISKNNTISTQIPKKHISKTKMVSVTFQSIDELPIFILTNELTQLIDTKTKTKFADEAAKESFLVDALSKIEAKIRATEQKLRGEYTYGTQVNYYKIATMQSNLMPTRTSFMALYTNDLVYDQEVMARLLAAPELVKFISVADSKTPIYIKIVKFENTSFSQREIEKSGIFIFNSQGFVISHPSGLIETRIN